MSVLPLIDKAALASRAALTTITLTMLALTTLAGIAHAQVFSDFDSTYIDHRSDSVTLGTAPLTYFSNVATTTTITSFSVYNQMLAPGDLKFLIFGSSLITPLAVVGVQHYNTADTSLNWKSSPTFSFTLQAGQSYSLGVIADVGANYGGNTDGNLTENGLTSAQQNENDQFYNSPILTGFGQGRIPIIVYGTQASPVPEASTTVSFGLLLAIGIGGVAVAAKKKAAATA